MSKHELRHGTMYLRFDFFKFKTSCHGDREIDGEKNRVIRRTYFLDSVPERTVEELSSY